MIARIVRERDPVVEAEERLIRKRKISVKEAAKLANLSVDSFERAYGHLIKKISKRRRAVEYGAALDLPGPDEV